MGGTLSPPGAGEDRGVKHGRSLQEPPVQTAPDTGHSPQAGCERCHSKPGAGVGIQRIGPAGRITEGFWRV